MKRNLSSLIISLLAVICLNISPLHAQTSANSEGLSIKAGVGLTSFYGDLGAPGFEVLKNTKSGFAGGIVKMFTPALGIQVQYFAGNLYSLRTDLAQYFTGTVQEISLSARVYPIMLVNSNFSGRLSPYVRGGIATTGFRSVRRDEATNTVFLPTYGFATDGGTPTSRENALSIPISLGLEYKLTDKISIEAEHSLSVTNTDIMDAFIGNAVGNDMFGFTQIGVKFTFNPTSSLEPREKKTLSGRTKSQANKRNPKSRESKTKDENNNLNEILEIGTPIESVIPSVQNIFVESTIPEKPSAGITFEVQIRINKGDYKGPAILTQIYPDGFTALESDIGYSTFSFVNQKVRIIWENMPVDSIINYSYHVRPSELVVGSHTINGNFEYKQPDSPKLIQFANYLFVDNTVETDMDAKILRLLDDDKKVKQVSTENIVQKEEVDLYDLQLEDLLNKYGSEKAISTRSDTPKTTGKNIVQHQVLPGIEYRVQFGAFRSQPEAARIVSKYNISENISEDYHQGWYKYTVGSCKTYEEASIYRDKFNQRTKIWSSFIVAYKNGKRLSNLREALK